MSGRERERNRQNWSKFLRCDRTDKRKSRTENSIRSMEYFKNHLTMFLLNHIWNANRLVRSGSKSQAANLSQWSNGISAFDGDLSKWKKKRYHVLFTLLARFSNWISHNIRHSFRCFGLLKCHWMLSSILSPCAYTARMHDVSLQSIWMHILIYLFIRYLL